MKQYGDGSMYVLRIKGKEIVGVRKGENKVITHFKLSDGTVLTHDEVVVAYNSGETSGLMLRDSTTTANASITSLPDGIKQNNLAELPLF